MNSKAGFSSREEQAKGEIGVSLMGVMVIDQAAGGFRAWRLLGARDGNVRESLHAFEGALEEQSPVGRDVRHLVQRIMTRGGVSTVETVYLGREGWLFYEPDV